MYNATGERGIRATEWAVNCSQHSMEINDDVHRSGRKPIGLITTNRRVHYKKNFIMLNS